MNIVAKIRSDAVKTMVAGYVDELNTKLNRWETIKDFRILDHDLSVESDELTPSMKVKRKVAEAKAACVGRAACVSVIPSSSRACAESGMSPLLGAEVTLADRSHLTLVVENLTGWRNLCGLLSQARMESPRGEPGIAFDALAASGLVPPQRQAGASGGHNALGGYSGIVRDKSTSQFRMLNKTKGPGMWSPRTQNDRMLFAATWREMLEQTPNVDFYQDMVKELIIEEGRAVGVKTGLGHEIDQSIADLVAIIGSIDIVLGDCDR